MGCCPGIHSKYVTTYTTVYNLIGKRSNESNESTAFISENRSSVIKKMRNRTLLWLLTFCLLLLATTIHTEDEVDNGSSAGDVSEETEGSTDASEPPGKDEEEEENEDEEGESEYTEFVCNLQYKRIGCYASADEEKEKKPVAKSKVILKEVQPKIEEFNEKLPKRACMCANEALTSGNAIFGLMNYTECWSGPDDSKYDREGPSNECVTFDLAPCEPSNEICAGKELANFMYYIDTPEHNKTPQEVQKELDEEKEKLETPNSKKKKKGKKGKKGKNKNNGMRR